MRTGLLRLNHVAGVRKDTTAAVVLCGSTESPVSQHASALSYFRRSASNLLRVLIPAGPHPPPESLPPDPSRTTIPCGINSEISSVLGCSAPLNHRPPYKVFPFTIHIQSFSTNTIISMCGCGSLRSLLRCDGQDERHYVAHI